MEDRVVCGFYYREVRKGNPFQDSGTPVTRSMGVCVRTHPVRVCQALTVHRQFGQNHSPLSFGG